VGGKSRREERQHLFEAAHFDPLLNNPQRVVE